MIASGELFRGIRKFRTWEVPVAATRRDRTTILNRPATATEQESTHGKENHGLHQLQVPAGAANPSPPIGPALGQRGLAIMEFCKQFNAQTQKMEKGSPIPVVITVYQDRSFTFEMRTPPVSYFIKKAAKLEADRRRPAATRSAAVTRRRSGDR